MDWLRQLRFRIIALFRRRRLEAEMEEEMRYHLEQEAATHRATGLDETEAHYAARRNFGGIEQIKESARDERGWLWLGQTMQEVHYAIRTLRRTPGYAATIVFTLALGIGAATAIFTTADSVLFRAPPYPTPEQLVVLGFKHTRFDFVQTQLVRQLAAYRERAKSFQSFAALQPERANLVVEGMPIGASVGRISLDYFATLGTIPMLGRGFVTGEDQTGHDNVVILGYRFWQNHFAGDPTVLGRSVSLGGNLCQVVGVLPSDFIPPPAHYADLYQPLAPVDDAAWPLAHYVYLIGRLQLGITAAQAQAELATIKVDVNARAARVLAERTPRVMPLVEQLHTWAPTTAYWAMLAAVGFLYAIAASNAGNLMSARLHGRRKEFSVRLALGCGHHQIARLVAIENLLLTTIAGLAGILVAQWIFPALLRFAPGSGATWFRSLSLNWHAWAFTAGLSILTGLIVSFPVSRRIKRATLSDGLNEGSRVSGESLRIRQLRSGLIVIETALAVTLLIGAGLMVRSVLRLERIDRGFDPINKVAVFFQTPSHAYRTPAARQAFYQKIQERLGVIPGVEGLAMTSCVPMAGVSTTNLTKPDGTVYYAGSNPVTPSYRHMLGLPLVRGRWFDDVVEGAAPVVVFNETMARDYFGDQDPLGRLFDHAGTPWQIIGIVRDVREEPKDRPRPQFYFPYWQTNGGNRASVLLRLSKSTDVAFGDAVRRAFYAIDPMVVLFPLRPLSEAADSQIAFDRYTLTVLQVLSALALLLTMAGILATMAYAVAQRMGEFGVRLAFGASPEQLFRMVLARGLKLAIIGLLVGAGTAWGLTRFLQSLLFETSAHDPLVYLAVGLLMLAAAALGCWWPAWRATRADLVSLLRSE